MRESQIMRDLMGHPVGGMVRANRCADEHRYPIATDVADTVRPHCTLEVKTGHNVNEEHVDHRWIGIRNALKLRSSENRGEVLDRPNLGRGKQTLISERIVIADHVWQKIDVDSRLRPYGIDGGFDR